MILLIYYHPQPIKASSQIEGLLLVWDKVRMDIKGTSLLDVLDKNRDFLLESIDYSNLVSTCA